MAGAASEKRLPTSPAAAGPGRAAVCPDDGAASPLRSRLKRAAFAPVDIATLVFFRIAFGAIMLWEVWRYLSAGRVTQYWLEPTVHFTYYGFGWVAPWPGWGMHAHWIALGVLSLCMTIGLWYRVSATLFFLGFTYQFLLEQARYLNHFYLISLISFLMIFVPAHRAFSVDAWRRPRLRAAFAPAWSLLLIQAQIGIAYFFGGLAKMNADWLRGEPMRTWLSKRADYPVLGSLVDSELTVCFFSYGGLLFDLLIVPALLWKRTRVLALCAAVFFHGMNSWMFQIGIFPWFMLPATAMFLDPSWPRRLVTWALAPFRKGEPGPVDPQQLLETPTPARRRLVTALVGVYLAVQFLVPLRHYLYPGDVSWTEEGHRFSWHMMLRSKRAEAQFFVTDPESHHTWIVDPGHHLTRWQEKKMAGRPDMLLQFAHHLADLARQDGCGEVEVRAKVMASLNGRRPQAFIDPDVDLAKQPRTLGHVDWILPLERALPMPEVYAKSRPADGR